MQCETNKLTSTVPGLFAQAFITISVPVKRAPLGSEWGFQLNGHVFDHINNLNHRSFTPNSKNKFASVFD